MTRVLPALTLITVVLVAGCASKPSGRRETNAGTSASNPSASNPAVNPSATASSVPRKAGGGYYLDDGLGADPPADLDLLPDAVPRIEKYASGANRPYNVFGVDYVPDLSGAPYKQRGVGSWYGRKFHGQRTSSGEIYDMYGMTAAHPTLPIPCYTLVTNLQNGKSVIVRVNDRGPFLHNRVMDLSYAAALKLGYLSSGSGTIEVELLMPSDIAAGRIPITTNSVYVASAAASGRRRDPGATTIVAQATPLASEKSVATASPLSIPMAAVPMAAVPTAPVPTSVPAASTSVASTSVEASALLALAPFENRSRETSAGPSSSAPSRSGIEAAQSTDAARGSSSDLPSSYADRGIPVDLIPDPQPVARLPETATRGGFYLQLGAFRVRAGADSFASHVAREIDPLVASKVQVSDLANGLYRVRIGPYAQRAEADGAALSLRSAIAQPVMVMPEAAR